MPYVPSEKTNPPATDRKELDIAVELLVHDVTKKITGNFSLVVIYKEVFRQVASGLSSLCHGLDLKHAKDPATGLAKTIYEIGKRYEYEGAFLGELNYAVTRFIQRVPQLMVAREKWKSTDELRYWLYACTVEALVWTSRQTVNYGLGIAGVFEDIKDEYKRRVNTAYEAAQILKSGDCYDTPYYTKLVEVVDEDGRHIGHQEIMVKRSDDTRTTDILKGQVVLRSAK